MTFEELDNEVAGWRTLLKTNPQEEAAPPFAVFEGWETTTVSIMGFFQARPIADHRPDQHWEACPPFEKLVLVRLPHPLRFSKGGFSTGAAMFIRHIFFFRV